MKGQGFVCRHGQTWGQGLVCKYWLVHIKRGIFFDKKTARKQIHGLVLKINY